MTLNLEPFSESLASILGCDGCLLFLLSQWTPLSGASPSWEACNVPPITEEENLNWLHPPLQLRYDWWSIVYQSDTPTHFDPGPKQQSETLEESVSGNWSSYSQTEFLAKQLGPLKSQLFHGSRSGFLARAVLCCAGSVVIKATADTYWEPALCQVLSWEFLFGLMVQGFSVSALFLFGAG